MLDDSQISGSFVNDGNLSGWKQFTSTFTATTTGEQTLKLLQTNRSAVAAAWDFGLDDVELRAITPAVGPTRGPGGFFFWANRPKIVPLRDSRKTFG
jgi:hypothetical protein